MFSIYLVADKDIVTFIKFITLITALQHYKVVMVVMVVMVCTLIPRDKQKTANPKVSGLKYEIVSDLVLALDVLVDSLCRLATRTHCEDYGSSASHGITARKDALA